MKKPHGVCGFGYSNCGTAVVGWQPPGPNEGWFEGIASRYSEPGIAIAGGLSQSKLAGDLPL